MPISDASLQAAQRDAAQRAILAKMNMAMQHQQQMNAATVNRTNPNVMRVFS